jgi:hypothetical protein
MNSTIDWPKPLSNIIGASGDSAQWNPIVADLAPGQGHGVRLVAVRRRMFRLA